MHWPDFLRQQAAVVDHNGPGGLAATPNRHVLQLVDDVRALQHTAENDVASVQPRGGAGGDEELRPVGVGAWGVGRGEQGERAGR